MNMKPTMKGHENPLLLDDQFSALAEVFPDPVFILDPVDQEVPLRILYVNRMIEQTHGYKPEELLGESIVQKLDIGNSQKLAAERRDQMLVGKDLCFDVQHHHRNGNLLEIEVRASLITWKGRPLILSVNRDVTQHRRNERALAESNERYQLIFKATNDMIWDWNLEAETEQLGENFYHHFGYTPQEISPSFEDWMSLVHPEERHLVEATLLEFFASDKDTYNCEYRLRRKDGSYAYIADRALMIRNEEGKPRRIIGSMSDITQRKIAEQKLVRSEERYRLVVEQQKELICKWLPDTTLTFVNTAFCKYFNASPEELIGRKIITMIPEDRVDDVLNHFERLRILKTTQRFEIDFPLENGKSRWVAWNDTPLLNEAGEINRYISIGSDITDLKEARKKEEALQKQLLQSQKMESIGRLAGGISHDFNNMLAAIQLHVELAIQDLDPNHPVQQELKQIQIAAERSAGITRQLLAFSRQQPVKAKVLDLNNSVEELLKLLNRLIGVNIRIEWNPQPGLWPVLIDPTHFDQLLTNLVVNARDAIQESGVITLTTQNIAQSKTNEEETAKVFGSEKLSQDFVRLTINDTGIGMDAETLEHIFEPFFTTKNLGKGTGLGLATVYGIVNQNNGQIRVKSNLGRGTNIQIDLPRTTQSESHDQQKTNVNLHSTNETILLVEDEPSILNLGFRILRNAGYKVLMASNGEEAITLEQQHNGRIDLLLTDIIMPGMGGVMLKHQIKKTRPGIRVLYMSGYASGNITQEEEEDPGFLHLQKPFTIEELLQAIRTILDSPSN